MAALARQTKLCSIGGAAIVVACLALTAAIPGAAVLAQDNKQGAGQAPAVAPAQLAPSASPPATATPPPGAGAPAVPAQPDPASRPGFLQQLGVWWDGSRTFFEPKSKEAPASAGDANKKPDEGASGAADAVKDAARKTATATQNAVNTAVEATKGAASTASDALKGAVEVTKSAATSIVRLPNTRVVELHAVCARAPNGGSDCAAAVAEGCRAKGFNGGNPLDTRTAQKCGPKPPQPGQTPGVQCAPETVVIRAVCQ